MKKEMQFINSEVVMWGIDPHHHSDRRRAAAALFQVTLREKAAKSTVLHSLHSASQLLGRRRGKEGEEEF